VLTFRAVAATVVALQIGLWIVSIGLRALVAATGYDVLTTGDPRLLALAAAFVVPAAVAAGFAAVQAAHQATPRLVTGCALTGAGMVWLWTLLEPFLGREPFWFQVALPAAVLAATAWGGRRALRRLAAGVE
jgi:hypothetical protein